MSRVIEKMFPFVHANTGFGVVWLEQLANQFCTVNKLNHQIDLCVLLNSYYLISSILI